MLVTFPFQEGASQIGHGRDVILRTVPLCMLVSLPFQEGASQIGHGRDVLLC